MSKVHNGWKLKEFDVSEVKENNGTIVVTSLRPELLCLADSPLVPLTQ